MSHSIKHSLFIYSSFSGAFRFCLPPFLSLLPHPFFSPFPITNSCGHPFGCLLGCMCEFFQGVSLEVDLLDFRVCQSLPHWYHKVAFQSGPSYPVTHRQCLEVLAVPHPGYYLVLSDMNFHTSDRCDILFYCF